VTLESVEESDELGLGLRVLGIFEYYTVDSCSEVEKVENLIRTLLDIVLEMSGNIDAADPVRILVENGGNIVYSLAFTDRHGSIDVNVMTFADVIKNILKGTELSKRLAAGEDYVVVRKDSVHQVKGLKTSLKVE
jgi:hypothetical protein